MYRKIIIIIILGILVFQSIGFAGGNQIDINKYKTQYHDLQDKILNYYKFFQLLMKYLLEKQKMENSSNQNRFNQNSQMQVQNSGNDNSISNLTDQDKQNIENYLQNIQDNQKNYKKFYNKKDNNQNNGLLDPFDDLLDTNNMNMFDNDPFFNKKLPNGDQEKDR